MAVHPRAIVDSKAKLDEDVEVGPWSVIGPDVRIGSGTRIGPNVIITGRTRIGRDNRIFQFNSIGDEPQDMKYGGEDTALEIGDGNTIREFCTLNRGTVQDRGVTTIGNDNWIMAYVHIAHDCVLGDHIVMANNATLAGHVRVGDWAILGGFAQVHQRCSIGAHAFISFSSSVNRSVPPFVTVSGEKSRVRGVNTEGLRRRGYSSEAVQNVRRAYRKLYRDGLTLAEALEQLRQMSDRAPEILPLVDFIAEDTERSLIR